MGGGGAPGSGCNRVCVCAEVQVIVESAVRPGSNRTSAVGEEQPPAPQDDQQEAVGGRRTLPVLVSVLLLVPLLLIVSSGLFICWRRAGRSGGGVRVALPHPDAASLLQITGS